MRHHLLPVIALITFTMACASESGEPATTADTPAAASVLDSADRVATVADLAGPEAVRYDPDQDVYFVANFNGEGMDRDANGFISRMSADGEVEELQFAVGTDTYPLHAPRGMFLVGDTLWVADADGLHGFDRGSGAQLAFVDFTMFEPGFLNDVAAGPDTDLYVTDTGRNRIYRVSEGSAEIAVEDSLLGPPNGITWDTGSNRFLVAPWGGIQELRTWDPASGAIGTLTTSSGAFFDGIEVVEGSVLVASQADSSIHVVDAGGTRQVIRTTGRPADIGVDTQRGRIAVPYIALNRVDIWQLPGAN